MINTIIRSKSKTRQKMPKNIALFKKRKKKHGINMALLLWFFFNSNINVGYRL